jgi:uncharacterized membrane protein
VVERVTSYGNPNGTPPPAGGGAPPDRPPGDAGGGAVLRRIAAQSRVDGPAAPLQRGLVAALERSGGLRSALRGEALGHPLHPPLTDVPIGAWTVGLLFDLLDLWHHNPGLRFAADAAHTVGLAGSAGAAVTGLAEWSDTAGGARRVGFVHGLTNSAVALLFGTSLLARARGARPLGVGLAALGYVLLAFSAWLGGELVFRYRVGVGRGDPHAGGRPPDDAGGAAAAPGRPPVPGAA